MNLRNGLSRRGCFGVLALVSSLAGCTESDRSSRESVRDSAGVAIVENVDAQAASRWTLSSKPSLKIGDDLGGDGFGRLAGVVRLGDGTIAAADALALTVRRFASSGDELESAGRRGSGPGEFEAIDRIWRVDGRQMGVWDGRLSRYTLVGSDGVVNSTVSLEPTAIRGRYAPIGFLPDGRLLAQGDARELPSLEYYRPDITLLTFDEEGSVADTLFSVPGVEMWDWVWEMGTTPLQIPFGRTTSFGVHEDAIYVAANEGYQVDRYDPAGTLLQRIRLDRSPRPLTEADIEAYREAEEAKDESGQVSKGPPTGFWRRAAEAAPYPDVIPHYDGFEIDDRGRIWIRDYPLGDAHPTTYTVFELADGRLLGTAEFPARFTIEQIRGGEVLGVWRDQLDLEHIRLYDLIER